MNWENIIIGVCFVAIAGLAYYYWKKLNEQNNTILELNKRIEAIELMFIPPPSQEELDIIFNQPKPTPTTDGGCSRILFNPAGGPTEGESVLARQMHKNTKHEQTQEQFRFEEVSPAPSAPRAEPFCRRAEPSSGQFIVHKADHGKILELNEPGEHFTGYCGLTPIVVQTQEEDLDEIADTLLKSMINEPSQNVVIRRKQAEPPLGQAQ